MNEPENMTPASGPAPRTPAPARERRGGGLVGPLLLIALGALFLASNAGVIVPLSVPQIIGLWPVLLILWGVDLALGRRMPALALLLCVAIIVGAAAFVVAYPRGLSGPRFADGAAQLTVPRSDARTLDLRVAGGAAVYTLAGGATDLVNATSSQSNLRLAQDRRTGDAASVRIEQSDVPVLGGFHDEVDLKVANDVPLSLRFDAGAGEFILDLADVRATGVTISVGAASLRLVLPKPQGEVAVRVSAGASSVVIENPLGVDARVTSNGAFTSVRNESARYAGGDRELSTGGYATARDRVTVRVDAGASSVTLR